MQRLQSEAVWPTAMETFFSQRDSQDSKTSITEATGGHMLHFLPSSCKCYWAYTYRYTQFMCRCSSFACTSHKGQIGFFLPRSQPRSAFTTTVSFLDKTSSKSFQEPVRTLIFPWLKTNLPSLECFLPTPCDSDFTN